MTALSRQVVTQLELRRHAADLQQAAADQEVYLAQLEAYQQKLEEANAKLQEDSLTDKLTGAGNRAAFDQRLAEEVYRSTRYRSAVSLLLIDVDRFKNFNDSLGHQAGDAALQAVAKALRCTRPSDFLGRYGGEEFAVLLPTTAREGACILAERMRKAVAATSFPFGPVTVSIGANTLASDSPDGDLLVSAADRALYAAKEAGRNRVIHADSIQLT